MLTSMKRDDRIGITEIRRLRTPDHIEWKPGQIKTTRGLMLEKKNNEVPQVRDKVLIENIQENTIERSHIRNIKSRNTQIEEDK